ncbi:MAG: B12-binding domain-containing radical SAM protein [Candidatus Omnitrophota bacterium]
MNGITLKNSNTALVLLPVFWPNMPPLSIACLKGFLFDKGIKVDCLDYNNYFFVKMPPEIKREWKINCNQEFEKNIAGILQKNFSENFEIMLKELLNYDVLGFSCYKSNIIFVREIIQLLKKLKKEIKIVVGGPEITQQYIEKGTAMTRTFLNGLVDLFVAGEGELPFFRYLEGTITQTEKHIAAFQEIRTKEELPVPDFSDFNLDLYPRKKSVSIMSSRGCIRQCAFCSERLLLKKFKVYPVEKIIAQIKLHKSKGIDYFIFHDSLINGDLKTFESFLDRIIDEFKEVKWEAQIAIRKDMPAKLFEKIKKSGCYNLFVGLETGSDKVLLSMNKGFTTTEALSFLKKLKKYDLSFGVSIITGFPDERKEDFNDSLKFILRHKKVITKIEQINPFVCYPGTNFNSKFDYKNNKISLERARNFIEVIKDAKIRYTNAFMLNLVQN